MSKTTKTNASANAVVNTTTITDVAVNNKNGLLTIHVNDEFPHISHDETVDGNYILVTISCFMKALDVPELREIENCIEEIQYERNNLFLRKNKLLQTKKLQYLSKVLEGAEIKVAQTEIPAFGTYNWGGKDIPNPYTNGEYSSPVILSFIEFTGEGVDECEVEKAKHIFDDWDAAVAIKHDYLKDILGCNNTSKAKPKAKDKSLAEKAAEKAAEEDE